MDKNKIQTSDNFQSEEQSKDVEPEDNALNQDDEDDYSLCPFFKTLVIENNLEERDESLLAYQIFVAKNKPSYKLLEDELMLLIRKNYKSIAKQGENPLKIFVPRLLELYDAAKKKGMNPLTMKVFLKINQRLKFEFPQDFNEEVKKIALEYWLKIDGMNITNFLNVFEIRDKINPEELIPIINGLIVLKKLTEAVYYITSMDLHQHFNISDLISMLVHQNKFPTAALLVEKSPSHQKDLVNELSTNKNASKAADLVKHFKLNPDDFPELVQRLQKNCLRYYRGQDNWMKVEEKFYDFKHILGYYVEDLIYEEKYDLALSIIKRHDLMKGAHITKPDTIQALEPYFTEPPTKTFTYTENTLFVTDGYAPTEEVLGEAAPGTYWNLKDLGIDIEKDIIWIDNSESDAFNKAVQNIFSSEAIGLDSEFRIRMTKFDQIGTALLQLAVSNKIYLFDTLKLATSSKYNKFLYELFANSKILKIGHTLSADLEILKYDQSEGEELVIRNHLDLPRVFKGLYPELRLSSLAYICETITKKPMSKYEQISNWNQRPLRKAQIHYAAMDAFILLKIYEEMKTILTSIGEDIEKYVDSSIGGVIVGSKKNKLKLEDEDNEEIDEIFKKNEQDLDEIGEEDAKKETTESKTKSNRPQGKKEKKEEEKKVEKPAKSNQNKKKEESAVQFISDPKYADFYSDSDNIKFVIDNMAFKLAKYMRNIGLDAEYLADKDHNQLTELALAEKRVVVTRDTRYFGKKTGVPCFFLKTQKTSDQLKELIDYFKLKITKNNFLSRCVKCNHVGLIVLNKEEARKQLQWKIEEDYEKYDTFWQCEKCKQIYWEGHTFKKAQKRFQEFTSSDEELEEGLAQNEALDTEGLQNFDFE